jgi:DNA-binding PadR family transcriptional regulator
MAGPPFGPRGGQHPGAGPYFGAGPHLGGVAHFAAGPFGGGRGRKRRGDVRAALLLVLAEEPRNGYQLMQEIEERSGGRWRPSPGSVYPALAQLEDERLVRAIERDEVKLFEITEEGRRHLEERHEHTPPWEDDEPVTISDLKSQIKQVAIAAAQVMQAGSEEQVARAGETLAEARRNLYRILAEEDDAAG